MAIEFNTNDDSATVMSYKRHEHDKRNDYSTIIVDIDELAARYEGYSKFLAMIYLYGVLMREI